MTNPVVVSWRENIDNYPETELPGAAIASPVTTLCCLGHLLLLSTVQLILSIVKPHLNHNSSKHNISWLGHENDHYPSLNLDVR